MSRIGLTDATFGDALRRAREAKGWSQSELARRLTSYLKKRVAPGTVSRWEKGEFPTSRDRVNACAHLLEVPVEALLIPGREKVTPPAISTKEHLASLVRARMGDEQVLIPKLLRVAAGAPVYAPPDDARGVSMGRKSIEAMVGPIPAKEPHSVVFAADVKGDSMAPGLLDGDTLIVKRFIPSRRAPMIEDGKVYVLTPDGDGHAQVKRLLLVDGHQLLVVSDNQRFPPKAVDLRKADRVQEMIIGRVVKLIRDL